MIFQNASWLDRAVTVVRRFLLCADYQAVFNSPAGQRVMHDLVRKTGLMKTHEGWSTEMVLYNAGQQDVVKHIAAMLRMRPEEFQRLTDRETHDG
jgi:hypothetical protein